MLELKKTEEWAFFFLFFGGILLVVNSILGAFIYAFSATNPLMPFLDGFGFFTFLTPNLHYIGMALNIVIGLLAFFSGLKLFFKPFYNLLTKIDVAITGIIMIFLGIGSYTLVGLLLTVGGIYCFIYRLSVEGANNKTAR
ncbi:MAG: hypothetical protein ACTSXO_00335 [Candidatus Heimdallarchaeota archaeon]|nr:hypothetical protein [Candidatus Heimdallarchaeota archaeon]RLI69309.1 MAG: hypothetical protein DRP02_10865 [Candidatus Gerdarchaeota archaeon]RLI69456.1 MAG: hypothetical protein DRO91_07765 [Candidatus Heimdallarchaeota archaeon]